MSKQRSISLPLAGAIALALCATASFATAQQAPSPPPPPAAPTPPPPPAAPTPPPPPQPGSAQMEQGTESSVSFPMQNGDGTVTVNSGMPANVKNYGPPPSFKSLDTNHDGRISETEARAYEPLDSDFLFASGQRKYITRAQYQHWVKTQH